MSGEILRTWKAVTRFEKFIQSAKYLLEKS